jgi:hypothetical protein
VIRRGDTVVSGISVGVAVLANGNDSSIIRQLDRESRALVKRSKQK